MGLLADIEDAHHTKGPPCSIGAAMARMAEADRVELEEAFRGPYATTDICRALRNRGIDLPVTTVQRHRRGDCKCR